LKNIQKDITIAIDGFSATGKSTVAKRLAKTLKYVYVDTGAMYRAVTYFALENNFIGEDFFHKDALILKLSSINLLFKFNVELGFSEIYLNDKNIEEPIRGVRVSSFVSDVAAVPEVRKFLVAMQRKMGKNKAIVMDGRDIGSVVFPNAELKIFLTADAKIRAERRLLEMQEKGIKATLEEILTNVEKRDKIDSTRDDSPLVQVEDAVLIDVSYITKEEQFHLVYSYAVDAISEMNMKSD